MELVKYVLLNCSSSSSTVRVRPSEIWFTIIENSSEYIAIPYITHTMTQSCIHTLKYMYTRMHTHTLSIPHTHTPGMNASTHTTFDLPACTGSAATQCVNIPPSSSHTHLESWTQLTHPTTSMSQAWPATHPTSSVGSTQWERETGALSIDSLIAWTLANQWITGCRFEPIFLVCTAAYTRDSYCTQLLNRNDPYNNLVMHP